MRVDPGVLYCNSKAKYAVAFLGFLAPTRLVGVVCEDVEPLIATRQPSRFLHKPPAQAHISHAISVDYMDSH
jgi:hypothetical protein